MSLPSTTACSLQRWHRPHRPRGKADAGFMLLECLMAILIVSFGVIGVMNLQANAIVETRDAGMRSKAGLLADEMVGILWADRANLPSYAMNDAAASVACGTGSNASSKPAVQQWLEKVKTLPLAGSYAQSISVAGNNVVTVRLCWKGPQDKTPNTHSAYAQIQG